MIKTKKLVCATQKALDKGIEAHKAKGWTVAETEIIPRGSMSKKFIYLAYLTRK